MKKFLLLMSLVLLPVLLIGGTVYAWGVQEPAVAQTRERAVALLNAMDTYAGTTALDRAREATRYPGVTVLVARNTADGHEIVLRITAADDQRTNVDWWPDQNAHYEATRCYRWTEDREWDTAAELDCPAQKDIDRTRAPQAAPIGPHVDREVRRALARIDDAAQGRAALAGVDGATVAALDGSIAVAVTGIEGYADGSPVRDCLLGYRTGNNVEVWRPSDIQTAPGEASCDPAGALSASLQAPPH